MHIHPIQCERSSAIYHEKIGVFLDDLGNAVAFGGSQNETVGGLLSNFESLDIHLSWDDAQHRVLQKIDNFKRLWSNTTDKLKVVDFPTAVAETLLIYGTVYETTPDLSLAPSKITEVDAPYLPRDLILRDIINGKQLMHGLQMVAAGYGKWQQELVRQSQLSLHWQN